MLDGRSDNHILVVLVVLSRDFEVQIVWRVEVLGGICCGVDEKASYGDCEERNQHLLLINISDGSERDGRDLIPVVSRV